MNKILITGAGSAQSNGVINSLIAYNSDDHIIGVGSDSFDLMLSKAHSKYLIPHSKSQDYKESLLKVIKLERPSMIHFQHDAELSVALTFKQEIENLGVKMLVPTYDEIDVCVHKYKSWVKFKSAGIKVPENIVINKPEDVQRALAELGSSSGQIWLRSAAIGGGGKGALPTSDYLEAVEWIERFNGWGDFIAAELLTSNTVTWLSIWQDGKLVVAQGRRRHSWAHSALSPSGVTGVTKVGETFSDATVDSVGVAAVKAISAKPNGIYGVDMAYDTSGMPNPTEINISRFFTTIEFFTRAGLNMPGILRDIVLNGAPPKLEKIINPLQDGLLWVRGMDCVPVLTTKNEMQKTLIKI